MTKKYLFKKVEGFSADKETITLSGKIYPTSVGVRSYLRDELVGQTCRVGFTDESQDIVSYVRVYDPSTSKKKPSESTGVVLDDAKVNLLLSVVADIKSELKSIHKVINKYMGDDIE